MIRGESRETEAGSACLGALGYRASASGSACLQESPAPAADQAEELGRQCSDCQRQGLGCFDWADRKWRCIPCADIALDQYQDRQLATDMRFLRQHAVRDQTSAFSHSYFLGFADSTSYIGKYMFDVNTRDIREYCEVVSRFFGRGTPLMHMESVGAGPRKYCEDIDVLCSTGAPRDIMVLEPASTGAVSDTHKGEIGQNLK